jgi:hypothetical protein
VVDNDADKVPYMAADEANEVEVPDDDSNALDRMINPPSVSPVFLNERDLSLLLVKELL